MARPRPGLVDVLTGLAALACPAVLFVVSGPVGAFVGVAAVLVWITAPVYGFVLGQFGLAAAVPDPGISNQFILVQGALFVLLVLGLVRRRQSPLIILVFIGAASTLITATLVGVARGIDTVVLAGGLIGVVAGVTYVLHRYELVVMGLTEPDGREES